MTRAPRHDWYLAQWMAAGNVRTQEELRDKTGWSKRKASELLSGTQRYNRDTLNEAAFALNCAPWELLMLPEDAAWIRQQRASVNKEAARLVAEKTREFLHRPTDIDDVINDDRPETASYYRG